LKAYSERPRHKLGVWGGAPPEGCGGAEPPHPNNQYQTCSIIDIEIQ